MEKAKNEVVQVILEESSSNSFELDFLNANEASDPLKGCDSNQSLKEEIILEYSRMIRGKLVEKENCLNDLKKQLEAKCFVNSKLHNKIKALEQQLDLANREKSEVKIKLSNAMKESSSKDSMIASISSKLKAAQFEVKFNQKPSSSEEGNQLKALLDKYQNSLEKTIAEKITLHEGKEVFFPKKVATPGSRQYVLMLPPCPNCQTLEEKLKRKHEEVQQQDYIIMPKKSK